MVIVAASAPSASTMAPSRLSDKNVELHDMRDSRKTGFGQNLRHHGNHSPHLLDMAAQVLGSVEIDEKEFRGVVKARTLQKVLMRTRKTRRLPAAQDRPPFAKARVFSEPGAQRRRAVELGEQQFVKGFLRHCRALLHRNRGFRRLNAPERLFAVTGTRYGGENLGSEK